MSVFIPFDFNWYSISNTSGIADTIGTYAGHPAQLMIGNKVFVSSFAGDGLDLAGVQSDVAIFWAPNFQPKNLGSANAALQLDGVAEQWQQQSSGRWY